MKNKEFCKDGSLTQYALACGCVQKAWNEKIQQSVYLESLRSGLYHVNGRNSKGNVDHFYFDRLTDAKKKFKKLQHTVN